MHFTSLSKTTRSNACSFRNNLDFPAENSIMAKNDQPKNKLQDIKLGTPFTILSDRTKGKKG